MSKLLAIKEWLTPGEAARYLSGIFNEEISVADLYRFALSQHLVLSAHFVNHGMACLGKRMRIRDAGFKALPSLKKSNGRSLIMLHGGGRPEFDAWLATNDDARKMIEEDENGLTFLLNGYQISDTECLTCERDVSRIEGIWDLPMIGAEALDIEHALQRETGGPAVTLTHLEGVFLSRPDGTYAHLMEHFSNNQYAPEEMRSRPWNDSDAYFPAGAIPEEAPIVVRTQALADFIASMSSQESEKPLDARERTSLLRIIRALDVIAKLPARGAATPIEVQLQSLGYATPAEATIRKVLAEARALQPDNPQ